MILLGYFNSKIRPNDLKSLGFFIFINKLLYYSLLLVINNNKGGVHMEQHTTIQPIYSNNLDLDLSLLKEYQTLTDVEKEIKDRKNQIKKIFKSYLEENDLKVTPEYQNLIGTLEDRISFVLDASMLEDLLEDEVFERIVIKNIDLNKVKEEFLDGNIPVDYLREAEEQNVSTSFYVRKVSARKTGSSKVPFWRTS